MPDFIDQTGRQIHLTHTPRRIVSLVPSQTELLADLGLDEAVIGITKFCVHPAEWFRKKTRVGGTKQLKMDIIHGLEPDLIIANKEENVKEQVEDLARSFPTWTSNVNNLDQAFEMISQIGAMTGRDAPANQLSLSIREGFKQLGPTARKRKTAYLIWQNPYMTVGGDTFIHSMMETAGFVNVFGYLRRYPETTVDEIRRTGCELLLLSSEPFPFNQKHVDQLQPKLPGIRIVLVDGEMFSWYGSRLLLAPSYFRSLIDTLWQS